MDQMCAHSLTVCVACISPLNVRPDTVPMPICGCGTERDQTKYSDGDIILTKEFKGRTHVYELSTNNTQVGVEFQLVFFHEYEGKLAETVKMKTSKIGKEIFSLNWPLSSSAMWKTYFGFRFFGQVPFSYCLKPNESQPKILTGHFQSVERNVLLVDRKYEYGIEYTHDCVPLTLRPNSIPLVLSTEGAYMTGEDFYDNIFDNIFGGIDDDFQRCGVNRYEICFDFRTTRDEMLQHHVNISGDGLCSQEIEVWNTNYGSMERYPENMKFTVVSKEEITDKLFWSSNGALQIYISSDQQALAFSIAISSVSFSYGVTEFSKRLNECSYPIWDIGCPNYLSIPIDMAMFPDKCGVWNLNLSSPHLDVICVNEYGVVTCDDDRIIWVSPHIMWFENVTTGWAGKYKLYVTCDDDTADFVATVCIYGMPSVALTRTSNVNNRPTFMCQGTSMSEPSELLTLKDTMQYTWYLTAGNDTFYVREASETYTIPDTFEGEYVKVHCKVKGKSSVSSERASATVSLKESVTFPDDSFCLMYPDIAHRSQNFTINIPNEWMPHHCQIWELSFESSSFDKVRKMKCTKKHNGVVCTQGTPSGEWLPPATVRVANMTSDMIGICDIVISCNSSTLYLPETCVYDYPSVPIISRSDGDNTITYTCKSVPNTVGMSKDHIFYTWIIDDIIGSDNNASNQSSSPSLKITGEYGESILFEKLAHDAISNITCVAREEASNVASSTSKSVNQPDISRTVLSSVIGVLGVVICVTIVVVWYTRRAVDKNLDKNITESTNDPTAVYHRESGFYLDVEDAAVAETVTFTPRLPPRDKTYSQPFEDTRVADETNHCLGIEGASPPEEISAKEDGNVPMPEEPSRADYLILVDDGNDNDWAEGGDNGDRGDEDEFYDDTAVRIEGRDDQDSSVASYDVGDSNAEDISVASYDDTAVPIGDRDDGDTRVASYDDTVVPEDSLLTKKLNDCKYNDRDSAGEYLPLQRNGGDDHQRTFSSQRKFGEYQHLEKTNNPTLDPGKDHSVEVGEATSGLSDPSFTDYLTMDIDSPDYLTTDIDSPDCLTTDIDSADYLTTDWKSATTDRLAYVFQMKNIENSKLKKELRLLRAKYEKLLSLHKDINE